jgi:hypothetical protein
MRSTPSQALDVSTGEPGVILHRLTRAENQTKFKSAAATSCLILVLPLLRPQMLRPSQDFYMGER